MLLKSSYPVRQIFALLLLNCSNFGLEAPRAFGLPEVSRELGLRVSGRAGVGGAGGGGGFGGSRLWGIWGRLWFLAGFSFWCGGWALRCHLWGLNTFLIFPNINKSWVVRQLTYTMFISNNHTPFHLWWKEHLVKHQRVSKYYENDCRF